MLAPMSSRLLGTASLRKAVIWPGVASIAMSLAGLTRADTASPYAIPAGQEELILTMLGRGKELPDGCELANVSVNVSLIVASYRCSGQTVTLELEHPSVAKRSARKTAAFSISPGEGQPSKALVETVAASLQRHEEQFRWIRPVVEQQSAPAAGAGWEGSALLGVAASLLLVGAMTWKRKRAISTSEALPPPDPATDA